MACDAVTNEELFSNDDERRAYEEFCAAQDEVTEFQLDKPALVCRWRMAHRKVPMLNRHIRALSQRRVSGEPLSTNMLSWAKQHVEWSLDAGVYDDPNGVLMLVIDVNGNAAMTVGDYAPLSDVSLTALAARAAEARTEQAETGVAPEVLCCVSAGTLYVGADVGEDLCGAMTLVEQLATTRGYSVKRVDDLSQVEHRAGAHLLVSDEHGVVLADADSEASADDRAAAEFLATGLAKLFA